LFTSISHSENKIIRVECIITGELWVL
jgi:hypothetical protein